MSIEELNNESVSSSSSSSPFEDQDQDQGQEYNHVSVVEKEIEDLDLDDEDDDDDDDFGSFDDASIHDDEEYTMATKDDADLGTGRRPAIYKALEDGDFPEVETYMKDVIKQIIPISRTETETETGLEPVPILNERASEILTRLSYTPAKKRYMNETAWKRSTIRREMLLNLGLPLNLDEVTTKTKQNGQQQQKEEQQHEPGRDLQLPDFKELGITSNQELEEILNTTTLYLDSLNIQKPEFYKSRTISTERLSNDCQTLSDELTKLKRIYVTWKEYERGLKKDNVMFQDYVENMVGNELKFRNEKLALQQKKLKRK